MFLFVGLGNPGPKYRANRHNIGFMAVDAVAGRYGFGAFRSRFRGLVAEGVIAERPVRILKPLTYMNESGRAVGEVLRYFRLRTAHAYVFYDDIDLRPGRCRVKIGGGAGGHNGLRSLDSHIGQDYWRVRLGIGHPGHRDRVHDYVLEDFSKAESQSWLPTLVDAVAGEAALLVAGDEDAFMSRVAQAVFPPAPRPSQPRTGNGAGAAAPEC